MGAFSDISGYLFHLRELSRADFFFCVCGVDCISHAIRCTRKSIEVDNFDEDKFEKFQVYEKSRGSYKNIEM